MFFEWIRCGPGRTARALLLGAGLALAVTATAGAEGRGNRAPGEVVAQHAERLGLDAETQAALARILEQSGVRHQEMRNQQRAARSQLRALLSAPKIDRAAVLAQAEILNELRSRSHRSRLDAILRIHELLTPEQRAALVAIREEERPWRRGRGPLGRCSRDLREVCGDAPDGPDALRCLADRWNGVSDACRAAVTESRGEPNEPQASSSP